MDIRRSGTDPTTIPYAALADAAAAWGDACRLIEAGLEVVQGLGIECCGPRVGPAVALRLEGWRDRAARLSDEVADQAAALRSAAATAQAADADVARSFR